MTAQVTEIDVYQGPEGAMQDPFENQKTIYYNIAHACLQDTNCTTFTTWGLWTGANASTAIYAATSLHDVWLAFVSGVYAICCVAVIALTALKRSGGGSE